jgi:hypothetical protein
MIYVIDRDRMGRFQPNGDAVVQRIRMGTPISVQQKLMRHADIRTTMNIYGDVVTNQESEALSEIASCLMDRTADHRSAKWLKIMAERVGFYYRHSRYLTVTPTLPR